MTSRSFALLLLCLGPPVLTAQNPPALDGYVTNPGTPQHFQVNGYDVACSSLKTLTNHLQGSQLDGSTVCPQHSLGEHLLVYGRKDKGHPLEASSITVVAPVDVVAEGSALTDRIVSRSAREVVVRADGFLLDITPDTRMTYESTLKPGFDAFQTNQWIAFHGIAHPDGPVMVQKASLGPNVISDFEDHLRNKTDFDPTSVSDADRQGGVGKFFTGLDRTRIPAFHDPALQAHINRIGARLIPAYQRALPLDDPSRIDFRFQLVEDSKYAYYALPSGIVLLSHTIASTDTDDQVAAVLATAIADVLQKQELRSQPARRAMLLSGFAGDAAGFFVPGAGLVTAIANQQVNSRIVHRQIQERSREALCLLHDAGFDLTQAPIAFWSMSEKYGKTLQNTPMSEHVRVLYDLLGTAWRDPNEPLPKLDPAPSAQPQS